MKKPLETAQRWLAQAENNLSVSQTMLGTAFWAETCFHSEQTAQLALKAFLFFKGRRFVNIHSVRQLASECGDMDSDFAALVAYGAYLDKFYLTTRYPDALPDPAVPFESFTAQEAQQALDYATEIVELVRGKVAPSAAE